MPKRYLEAAVAAAEVSISITYGEQQNRQTTQVQVNQAQASQIQAGGKTTLIAGGAGEQSNINITGSDVSGKAGTGLIADNDITLQSAEQSSSERSNNKSSGWNAGAAVSFGQGGWSLGVTAGGNVGKGYGNGDSVTHRHSHIGEKGSQTLIQRGGDTIIKGAQVRGKGVQVNAKNLSIQSVQDSETYQSKQQNAGAQVTVGYGFSASGSYSQSKVKADHASVTEQSGIYAGERGNRPERIRRRPQSKAAGQSPAQHDRRRLVHPDRQRGGHNGRHREFRPVLPNWTTLQRAGAGKPGRQADGGSGNRPHPRPRRTRGGGIRSGRQRRFNRRAGIGRRGSGRTRHRQMAVRQRRRRQPERGGKRDRFGHHEDTGYGRRGGCGKFVCGCRAGRDGG